MVGPRCCAATDDQQVVPTLPNNPLPESLESCVLNLEPGGSASRHPASDDGWPGTVWGKPCAERRDPDTERGFPNPERSKPDMDCGKPCADCDVPDTDSDNPDSDCDNPSEEKGVLRQEYRVISLNMSGLGLSSPCSRPPEDKKDGSKPQRAQAARNALGRGQDAHGGLRASGGVAAGVVQGAGGAAAC